MNKNLHRIIFSHSRGQRMVVAETASAQGKAAGGETSGASAAPATLANLHPLRFAVLTALGMVMWLQPAAFTSVHAQIIAAPGAPAGQRPTVLQTANGLAQVNIQTPSAAGVSHNTYNQFDVPQGGVILNNSRTNVQTQLGGFVGANPWLATGPARVILNEVQSANPSQIRGYVEVAGQRAEVNRSGMISGNSVQLDAARDIQIDAITRQFSASRGTVAGNVSGSNTEVGPQGSIVSRGDMLINAGRDIKLAGALVSAQGNASLNAGANLVVDTIQTQQGTQDVSVMGVRRTQGTTNLGSTLQTGGNLALSSGADTTLRAAQIGAGQDLSVIANGNLNIVAATDTAQLDENMRAKGYVRNDHTAQERVVGSNLVAGGNVTLAALQTAPDGSKGNITVQGSSVNAVTGQLNVVAANNVNIIEAREKGEYDLFNETKGSKTFSSKTQTARDTGSSDIAVGSSLSGREISIVAGKDLTVRGSSVVSDNKTTLLATNNITLEAAQNFETSTTFREEKKSGLMSSGGIGFTVGSKQQSSDQQNTRTSASASTVGSTAGNVTATAGNNYRQVGSDVLTPAGNVTISAQKVDIVEARETSRSATEEKFKQSGVNTASLDSGLHRHCYDDSELVPVNERTRT